MLYRDLSIIVSNDLNPSHHYVRAQPRHIGKPIAYRGAIYPDITICLYVFLWCE